MGLSLHLPLCKAWLLWWAEPAAWQLQLVEVAWVRARVAVLCREVGTPVAAMTLEAVVAMGGTTAQPAGAGH